MIQALTCPHCASVDTSFKKKAAQWECNDCEKRFDAPDASTPRAQRIFLSYGHDDNTPLVLALRERLELAGHIVWIDQTQIKVGDDWRLAIKKGLLESDRVLSFLSKHSTRDPGVCLDEIGIALAHRHGAIATLLVEPIEQVQPPPSLSHIQYLNLASWKQERDAGEAHWMQWLDAQAAILIDIIARNTGFAGDMDELQSLLKPQTHSARLGNLVERGFCGRDWLFEEISAWRSSQSERTFWLVADPGMGKSAVAARLAHTTAQYTVAYHFCRFDEPGTRSPQTFVCTLAFQLAARLPGYRQLLLYATRYPSKPLAEQNADDLFSLLLTGPLRSSIDGGQSDDRLLVIVDALDEAPAIADLIARRQGDLPSWVALLLTSRPDTQIQSALAGVLPHRLASEDPRNAADLASFVTQWFNSTHPAPPAHAQEALLKNSEGNILYLATAREGAKAGVFDLNNTDAYPKGLGALYRSWFDRKFGAGGDAVGSWPASYALLELVCASPEPLPLTVARQTLNWVGQDRIVASRPLGSLIQEQDSTVEMFHRSLAEWLQDPVLADRYWVNVQDGRIRLAKTLWDGLQNVIKAKDAGYAHRVLPGLLLAIPTERRHEVWGEDQQRFELMDQLTTALEEFQEYKIRLSRLDLARVNAQECELHFGEESEQCLTTLSGLANALQEVTSEFSEARAIFERVLAIREKVLGPEHPGTAASMNSLAGLLQTTGEYEAALQLYQRALVICEKVQGPEHRDTAQALNNLALLLDTLGKYAAARPLYERSLAIIEEALVPEQPETAVVLNNLAYLLVSKGEYIVARPMYERSLAILEKSLGPEHPDTAKGLGNLAALLEEMGEYEAALPLYERALSIHEKVLGSEHPDTAIGLSNLAGLLQTIGAYDASRPLYERALAIREKVLGHEHPDTASGLNNLASLLDAIGDYGAAQSLYERSLATREKVLGPEHPDTAAGLNNLAGLLRTVGGYETAQSLYERSLAIKEKVLGPEHPDTANGLGNMAGLLQELGEYARALPLYERALSIHERVLGPEHPTTATGLNNLAGLLEATGDYDAARLLFERSLAVREKVLGPEHPDTATGLNNLVGLLESIGDFDAARRLYERLLTIKEKVQGPEHPDTLNNAVSLGVLLRDHIDVDLAEPLILGVVEKCEKAEKADPQVHSRALSGLGKLYEMQEKKAQAIEYYEKCLKIRRDAFGEDHESTVLVKDRLGKLVTG